MEKKKAMALHSSTLARKLPWMEEPGRLQSMGSRRVRQDWVTSLSLFTFMHWRRKWQPTPVFLPGESQGRVSLVGCHLWGRTESDTTEATYQQQQHALENRLKISPLYTNLLIPWLLIDEESACSAGDPGSIPGLGRSPGEGNFNTLQYSCLENSTDRGAWRATIHRVAKSQTWLRDCPCHLFH